ncbi:MAG TPA: aconitate hydratase AcnA [Clostridiales bacterium]|nr:aconitate hydratase AcnA [Clostridiales bacterium]
MNNRPGMNKKTLSVNGKDYTYYDITSLEQYGLGDTSRLPCSLKILLESALRNYDDKLVTMEHIERIASWSGHSTRDEIPFTPTRIILQDFTGVPVVVDLAAMRTAMHESGADASKINPIIPVDLVIDHSVIVDSYGSSGSLSYNVKKEFERNRERYELLKWAQNTFSNFRVFPPSIGIVHQVNLELLASVATTRSNGEEEAVFPDTLVGTDSHTPMINGIGVLGWGVGGIEAEACMLGQPLYFLVPDVIGFRLTGSLPVGATATDLVLTITELLRKEGVIGKFVEFFGEGTGNISVEDRATVANMCPEYGATVAYFPVDEKTLDYLRATGREEAQISLIEKYYKAQGMFRTDDSPIPMFTKVLELDLSTVEPSLAGPKRPQDRINLKDMKESYRKAIIAPLEEGGYGAEKSNADKVVAIRYKDGEVEELRNGSVVISAITSCTNTSNPHVMIGAGLLAKKAVERGLKKPRYVKSSFGPGSLVVTEYLKNAGLLPYLEQLGYNIVGYGCTTCIGNSGPLPDEVSEAIDNNDMTVAAVLSGNRNFEGRIHPQTKMNYLASPPLVIAYGLAGTVDIDLYSEPISYNDKNEPVYLRDIWPSDEEIEAMIKAHVKPHIYRDKYDGIFHANELWNSLPVSDGDIYKWSETSTYIRRPTFFDNIEIDPNKVKDILGARVLALLGDSVTTDHISPAGSIPETSDAGIHLTSQNIKTDQLNTYGSRRGTHEVMMRGTFANIRIRNRMVPGVEGGFTKYIPTGEVMSIYNAAMKYRETDTPLVVIAGKEYGTGSSRDWAAKGTALLGVKAVLARGFERIHRSNLIGMGILPIQFPEGASAESLGITGTESFDIIGLSENPYPNKRLQVRAVRQDGSTLAFEAIARIDSNIEMEYYVHGGILNMILRNFWKSDDH